MIKFRVSKNHAVWRMVCGRQEKEQGSEGRRVVRGGEQRGAAEGGRERAQVSLLGEKGITEGPGQGGW